MRSGRPVLVALVLFALPLSDPAGASWSATTGPGAHATAWAKTLLPPTSLTAVGGCGMLVAGPSVTLNWTATSSPFASGYDVRRSSTNGGPYTTIGTVTGHSTTTFVDSTVAGMSSTYFYVVRAAHLAWSSAHSNQASATTPMLCL